MAKNIANNKTKIKKRSKIADVVIRLIKEKPLGTIGAVITLIMLLIAIFANVLAPHGMNDMFTDFVMVPPSAKFFFGTDNLGRDIFSRVIFGARISVIVGLVATLIGSIAQQVNRGVFPAPFELVQVKAQVEQRLSQNALFP